MTLKEIETEIKALLDESEKKKADLFYKQTGTDHGH